MTISFDLTPDQRQIIDSVSKALRDNWPASRFRAVARQDTSRDEMADAVRLGWIGLSVQDSEGGSGFSVVEDALTFRELGRHLITPNAFASSVAAKIALGSGRQALARDILEGRTAVALANPVREPSDGYFVYDGDAAQYVLAINNSDLALMPVELLQRQDAAHCVDRTVGLRPARGPDLKHPSAIGGDAEARLFAELLLSSQLLGIAEAAMDLAVDYAKTRHQFGQPIGAFQAIKHFCADMKIRVSVLTAQVLLAALCLKEHKADAELQVASAGLLAARYAVLNAAAGIQIHGAMGFTAECDAHLYLLRAHLLENIGRTQGQRENLMMTLPPRAV